MKTKSYYIARDKDKSLWIFNCRPQRHKDIWTILTPCEVDRTAELDTYKEYPNTDLFKNLTFESEPLKLVSKKNNEYIKGKSYFIAADGIGNLHIYDGKPRRNYETEVWEKDPGVKYQYIAPNDLFGEPAFADDPIELVLVDKV